MTRGDTQIHSAGVSTFDHMRRQGLTGDHERFSDAAYLAAANQGNPVVEFRQRGETLPAPHRTKYLRGNGGRVPQYGPNRGSVLEGAENQPFDRRGS